MQNEEIKKEICVLIESIDNPRILENLRIIVTDYEIYISRQQMNEAG